jgi:hypothetical protein
MIDPRGFLYETHPHHTLISPSSPAVTLGVSCATQKPRVPQLEACTRVSGGTGWVLRALGERLKSRSTTTDRVLTSQAGVPERVSHGVRVQVLGAVVIELLFSIEDKIADAILVPVHKYVDTNANASAAEDGAAHRQCVAEIISLSEGIAADIFSERPARAFARPRNGFPGRNQKHT